MPGRRGLALAGILAAVVGSIAWAGSGGSATAGARRLHWYINPDDGGQTEIARRCTRQAQGRYEIETALLPQSASDQREQLLRRLAAKDSSIDLMSLDVVEVPEFAQAGFLAPISRRDAPGLVAGDIRPAVRTAIWDGRLAAIPMWANTQLLWYRKSVASRQGLDPATRPVTWSEIIRAARARHATVGVQAGRYEGYTVWINALVESAGGHIIKARGTRGGQIRLGLDSAAGQRAAAVIRQLAHGGVAGPALSTSDEESSRALFQGPSGGFMVNWPYVWRAAQAAVAERSLSRATLADIGWGMYPRVLKGSPSRPPLGGIDLGIGAFSPHQALALEAARCITSTPNQTYYFLHDGNPAVRASVFSDRRVLAEFPMAPLLRQSLQAAAPRPRTAAYGDLSGALQESFHPPDSVGPHTPAAASAFILEVLEGKRLL
jgi:multiple sugar transport system substrate-binding protein